MTFNPLWCLKNRHLQTILPSFILPPLPALGKERIELDDGDFIDLLWTNSRSSQVLLILHGLEGSANSHYARRILNFCSKNDISAVLMHFRGCSGEPNRLLRSYHSGETRDLALVIEYLKKKGISNIALLGYSLGGNVTLKYMGESVTDPAIRCAVAVSVPLRLDICANTMDRGFAKIYQSSLLGRMIKKVQAKQAMFDASDRQFPDPSSMRNFRQFDDAFTAPVHGFESAEHYYQVCSSRQFLKSIDKPTLLIQSADDPFMTDAVLPDRRELSDSVEFELSTHGGHVGFVSAKGMRPESWLEPRIYQFINGQKSFNKRVDRRATPIVRGIR